MRYRYERLPYDPKCVRFGKCPLLPMFADSPLNDARTLVYRDRYAPFAYHSKEWKARYNKRVAVERVFGRLKGHRKLNALRTRRMAKVWLHIAMSMIGMVSAAIANAGRDLNKARSALVA